MPGPRRHSGLDRQCVRPPYEARGLLQGEKQSSQTQTIMGGYAKILWERKGIHEPIWSIRQLGLWTIHQEELFTQIAVQRCKVQKTGPICLWADTKITRQTQISQTGCHQQCHQMGVISPQRMLQNAVFSISILLWSTRTALHTIRLAIRCTGQGVQRLGMDSKAQDPHVPGIMPRREQTKQQLVLPRWGLWGHSVPIQQTKRGA